MRADRPSRLMRSSARSGGRNTLENPNLLRGLALSKVVKFADYWTDDTQLCPAPCCPTGATTYASLSQLAEAPGWGPGHSNMRVVTIIGLLPITIIEGSSGLRTAEVTISERWFRCARSARVDALASR